MPDAVAQHQRLLARSHPQWYGFAEGDVAAVDALRVVVELHRPAPGPFAVTTGEEMALCYGCSHLGWSKPVTVVGWFDCATVKAVAGALGVDLNG